VADPKKNAWEMVLDAPSGAEVPPMRVSMQCSFDGTYVAFLAWVEETFNNPALLPLSGTLGSRTPEPGVPNLYCTFNGSVEQFVNFMNVTFKDPQPYRIAVTVGDATVNANEDRAPREPTGEIGSETKLTGLSPELQKLVRTRKMDRKQAVEIMKQHHLSIATGSRIATIKLVREILHYDLKVAKELVDRLPPWAAPEM
jgi:hypothetical protein